MFPLSTPLPLKNYLHYPKKEMSMGLSIHTFAAERKNPYNEAAKEVLRYPNMMKGIGLSFADMLDKLISLYVE